MNSRILILLATVFLFSTSVAAQEFSTLDIVPANAQAALAVPKLAEAAPKVKALVDEAFPSMSYIMGSMLDSLVKSFYEQAGFEYEGAKDLDGLVDRQRPGAFLAIDDGDDDYDELYAIPVADLEKIALEFEVDLDQLKSGDIVRGKSGDFLKYANECLYITSGERQVLESVDLGDSIRDRLTPKQQQYFSSSDALLFMNRKLANDIMNGAFNQFGDLSWLFNFSEDENESNPGIVGQLNAAAEEFEFGLAGIDLSNGIGLRYTTFFKKVQNSQSQKLIEAVRGGDGASNLNHLPNGKFVAAFAARGTGDKNALAAKAILKMIVKRVSPGEEILSADDKPVFYQLFAETWKKLNGTRLGIYRINSDLEEDGNLVAIAIFDVADPPALLAQLPELVKFANESAGRNTAENDLLPISFKYESGVGMISGYPVDNLVIETDRLDDKTRKRFQRLFGAQAKQFKLVPLKHHLLMTVGTDTQLLKKTIANLENGAIGLANHPAIVEANKHLDLRRKVELFISPENLNNIYSHAPKLDPYVESQQVAGFAFTLEPSRVGLDAWIPASELNAILNSSY